MSSISTLHNLAMPLSLVLGKTTLSPEEVSKFNNDFTSLKGFGEHFLYLITFGQVHKGKEREERFMSLIGNMLEGPRNKGDTIVCTYRDPTSNVNRIRLEINQNGIRLKTFNEYTHDRVAHFYLPAQLTSDSQGIKRALLRIHIEKCIESNDGYLCGNLYEQDLSGIDFGTLNMSHINLRKADLSGSDLSRANLTETILVGARIPQKSLARAEAQRAYTEGVTICDEE